jgi:hypothetical protein
MSCSVSIYDLLEQGSYLGKEGRRHFYRMGNKFFIYHTETNMVIPIENPENYMFFNKWVTNDKQLACGNINANHASC